GASNERTRPISMVMGPQREVAFSKAVKSLGCFVSVDICVFSFPGMRNTKSSNCVCKVSDNETNENCNPECPFFKPSSIEHLGEPKKRRHGSCRGQYRH